MYRLTVTYDHPADPDKFVRHYREVHSVLGGKLPGLRNYEWGVCETLDGSRPPHFLTAVMDWDSKDAALAALSSPEGQEGAADIANFTTPDAFHMTFTEFTKTV